MESIAIIGLGYVGLPLAVAFARKKVKVIGIDVDKEKVERLKDGDTLIRTLRREDIAEGVSAGYLSFSTDYSCISRVSAILICVPTPLDSHLSPDLSYIRETCRRMEGYLRVGHLISLESTTYPGTTREVVVETVKNIGLSAGEDINIVYSPEREDPGNKEFSTINIPKVISGYSQACLERGIRLYELAFKSLHKVTSLEAAEMTKIVENVQRCVNISLMNELKQISIKMGIDIFEVIDAASTKPFGFTTFYPGPGMGGHCIPVDPFYLSWKAKELGMNARFIELAGVINREMPGTIVTSIERSLNNSRKSVNGSRVLILGIAYKKNIDDLREAPALEIISQLVRSKADVRFVDPYFRSIPSTRHYTLDIKSANLSEESLRWADIVVLVTDHDLFDYELIAKHSKVIIDCRGRMRGYSNVIGA